MIETIGNLFLNTVRSFPKADLMMVKKEGRYVSLSTEEFKNRLRHFALGLTALGHKAGDKLVILAENSPDWVMTDIANLCIGGITVPIYTSLVPEQIKYIIRNSDARVVVCSSPELWEKVDSIKSELSDVEHFITIGPGSTEGALTCDDVQRKGEELDEKNPDLFESTVSTVRPDDIASIIYTSGTTGIPKGVMLTHSNFMSNIVSISAIVEFSEKDTVLSFLPLSHVLERMVTFTYLYKGCSVAYAESVETVPDNLIEIKPHIMVSVPRLFEKIYSKVMDNVLASSPLKRKIFFWAARVGRQYGLRKLQGQPVTGLLRFKRNLAHKLVFSKIIEKTGGRIRFFVSGGAALSKDIAEFFYSLGLVVLEGYGLTETSPVITVNTFENLKFGTVGKPIPGVEVKIAEDGEILSRGPNIMKGYYKMEEETREVIKGGWFYTGDIGHLDDDGFLVITDRKKDIIVTAGGKNVAPQAIENMLKTNPYILESVVVGDRRKFVSALIIPNFEKIEEFAKKKNIPYEDTSDLVKNEMIIELIQEEVDRATLNLASYERIKKIRLLDREFEIEQGEITPSLKVKRNIVEEKYKDLIDSMYMEEG